MFQTLRHAVGSWLFGLRLIATAAWQGQKAWALALWKANPVRTGVAVGVLVLLSFCSGKALGAEPSGTWEPLANEFSNFTLTEPTKIRYGVDSRWNVFDLNPGTYPCHYGQFGDPAPGNFGKKCQKFVPAAAPPPPASTAAEPFKVCDIDWSLDIRERVRFHQPMPAGLGGELWAVWPCEGKKAQAQAYTAAEFSQFVDYVKNPLNWLTINQWIAGRQTWAFSQARYDFLKAREAEHAALLWPSTEPPAPPAPRAVVAAGAADRPVYRLKADGSRNTTAVSGVRVAAGTPCDPDKRPAVNPGSYMSVQGQVATSGARITEDLYASCTLTQ
jgi:hypothetical protein